MDRHLTARSAKVIRLVKCFLKQDVIWFVCLLFGAEQRSSSLSCRVPGSGVTGFSVSLAGRPRWLGS